jgi:HAD superfamily hydrolase (TIGR01549 family)
MLILFDLDGTLIESKESIVNSTITTLMKYSKELPSNEQVERTIGIPIINLLKKYVDKSLLDQAVTEFREHLIVETPKTTKLYSDTMMVLKGLSSNSHTLKVVTNKKTLLAKKILNLMEIDSYFNEVIGIDLGDPKPSPSMLLLAAKGHKTREVIMVGDRPEDVVAAKEAGFKSVFVDHGTVIRADAEAFYPDFLVNNLKELLNLDLMK